MRLLTAWVGIAIFASTAFSALNVPITVKEPSGYAATQYPVVAMVPLPRGAYQDVSTFRLTDNSGTTVPAQFNPILRNVFQDNSLRFVQIIFNATLTAKGSAVFNLKDDGGAVQPSSPVSITTSGDILTVNTGALKFTVKKSGFNLFNKVWLMPGDILIADSSAQQGACFDTDFGKQWFQDRTIDTFAVEESGPMRVVIRLESYGHNVDSTNQTPGFIFRLYAYAGSRNVKVDAGIINGERTLWGGPIYFNSFSLKTPLTVSNPTVRFGTPSGVQSLPAGNGQRLVQWDAEQWRLFDGTAVLSDSGAQSLPGWFDVSDANKGLLVTQRFFWETHPAGYSVDGQGNFFTVPFPQTPYHTSYWNWGQKLDTIEQFYLEDMQGHRKEYLYYFHDATGASDADCRNLNRHFQWPPVATVPLAWHRSCKTTLEFSGVLPDSIAQPGAVSDTLAWSASYYDKVSDNFSFGWQQYKSDRRYVCDVGAWPRSTAPFLINGSTGQYFGAEMWALGEMNLRGYWCPGWIESVHQPASGMGYINYCSGVWRSTAMQYYMRKPATGYKTGTHGMKWGARDFEHLWIYNIEEFYNYSGDPWIRDCMLFWCEYFKGVNKNVMTDSTLGNIATRGSGHALTAFLMAVRITNSARYKPYADKWVKTVFDRSSKYYPKFGLPNGEGPFQLQFLDRAITSYMQMVEGTHPVDWQRGFQALFAHAEWNTYYANYCYYWQDTATATCLANTKPGGSGGSYAEAMGYMATLTQHRPFVKNLLQVWNTGNGMYFNTSKWNGDWMGRTTIAWGEKFRNRPGLDTVPPAQVTDLSGSVLPWGVNISFTPPQGAHHYHVVWGYKPIKEGPDSSNLDSLKYWQAFPGGVRNVGASGPETCTVVLPLKDTIFYFAVRTFDTLNNISLISNLYSTKANIIAVEEGGEVTAALNIGANPNPFNPEVRITVSGLAAGTRSLRIYDAAGRVVANLDETVRGLAAHRRAGVRWNAKGLPSGLYIIKAVSGNRMMVKKVVLAR